MKPKSLGTFEFGYSAFEVYVREGDGAEFMLLSSEQTKNNRTPAKITIGLDVSWPEIFGSLLHEALEALLTIDRCRFRDTMRYYNDHASYVFMFNHDILTNVCECASDGIMTVLPKLKRAWAEHKHKKSK